MCYSVEVDKYGNQKKLNDIVTCSKKEETKIRAISELHSIEMSISNLWKQLPDLQIIDSKDNRDDHRNEYSIDKNRPRS
jgi:hypothetical protein